MPNGSIPFFDGQDLTGWQGRAGCWRVENGSIVGVPSADPPKVHTFLISQKLYKDFDLKFRVRLKDGIGNSGLNFRSTVTDWKEFKVTGPQVEIDGSADREFPPGSIVTEGGPTRQLPSIIAPKDVVNRIWNGADFNAMHIRCVGRHVTVRIDGTTVVDGDFPSMPAEGVIAWQIHARVPPKEIIFSDIEFTELNGTEQVAQQPARNGAADGFVPLFNGKDLTGWRTHRSQPAGWRVREDGLLIGTGAVSHLYTDRGDYANVHVRAEVRINNVGNSGLYLRSTFGPRHPAQKPTYPNGYEAQIYSGPDPRRTGSLYVTTDKFSEVIQRDAGVPPNTWFTLEAIADGNRIVIKVDGREVLNHVDPGRLHDRGHIALQLHDPNTVVAFRSIEVKELPAGQTRPPASPETSAERTLEGMALLQSVDNELSKVTFPAQNADAKAKRDLKDEAIRELRAAIKAIGDGMRGKSVQDHLDRARERIRKLETQIDPASAPKAKGKTAMQKQRDSVGRAETLLNQAIRALRDAKVIDPPAP